MDAVVKIKDKEISNQNQMINNLKKDNSTLGNRIDTEIGLEKLMKYENSLKEAERGGIRSCCGRSRPCRGSRRSRGRRWRR